MEHFEGVCVLWGRYVHMSCMIVLVNYNNY